jgi:hypothetical protein
LRYRGFRECPLGGLGKMLKWMRNKLRAYLLAFKAKIVNFFSGLKALVNSPVPTIKSWFGIGIQVWIENPETKSEVILPQWVVILSHTLNTLSNMTYVGAVVAYYCKSYLLGTILSILSFLLGVVSSAVYTYWLWVHWLLTGFRILRMIADAIKEKLLWQWEKLLLERR